MKNENWKTWIITFLRIAIGWHFLYEGFSKLPLGTWSSYRYLIHSAGPIQSFYHWIANSSVLLQLSDLLNIFGLIIIGLALFLGIFTRLASLAGAFLLILYYFAYPPFGASIMQLSGEHLYIINKQLIESIALLLLGLLKNRGFGIEKLWLHYRNRHKNVKTTDSSEAVNSRREALKNLATLPVLGFMGWGALRSGNVYETDVTSGATIQIGESELKDLKGTLPKGKIKDHSISRLVMGGNLIGGWAHSRDLIYVKSLMKAYNTEKRVYETLQLAEKAGINTINIGFSSNPLMAKYKKIFGSKIKVISQVAPDKENMDYFKQINEAIDYGADIIQVQGNWCDWLVKDHKTEIIDKMLNHIREQGYTAGLASHTIDALIACTEYGILPDYYMKTMHHDNYWSAHPRENRVPFEVDGTKYLDHNKFHDNLFCLFPERSVEFVQNAKVPVMGFKVLAAGAIPPEDGFAWAYKNGADFICVGMFDFQVVNNVNTTIDILNNLEGRNRKWYG